MVVAYPAHLSDARAASHLVVSFFLSSAPVVQFGQAGRQAGQAGGTYMELGILRDGTTASLSRISGPALIKTLVLRILKKNG